MRDDFPEDVKRILSSRVNSLCSNPDCRAQTSGPQDDSTKAINLGVAAHITAASEGGPRYKQKLSPEERRHADNGIWLCQNCAKLIDTDVSRFNESLLRAWKMVAEDQARNSLGKTGSEVGAKLSPRLELYLELEGIKRDPYSPFTPVRSFVLGLTNKPGWGSAKFPALRYRRACGLRLDSFGIDGSFGFGLPPTPSDNEWASFRGGADHMIHSGETLKIARLFQNGRTKDGRPTRLPPFRPYNVPSTWVFDAVDFQCEISAEGIPTVPGQKSVPEEVIQLKFP